MDNTMQEYINEEKLDQLSLELEGLLLDAFIAVIQKLKERNQEVMQASLKSGQNNMDF